MFVSLFCFLIFHSSSGLGSGTLEAAPEAGVRACVITEGCSQEEAVGREGSGTGKGEGAHQGVVAAGIQPGPAHREVWRVSSSGRKPWARGQPCVAT